MRSALGHAKAKIGRAHEHVSAFEDLTRAWAEVGPYRAVTDTQGAPDWVRVVMGVVTGERVEIAFEGVASRLTERGVTVQKLDTVGPFSVQRAELSRWRLHHR